jgi:hypothetical protein
MGRLRMAHAAVALSLLIAGTVLAPGVAIGQGTAHALPIGASDITDTANGKRLIKEAKERFERQGHKAGELRAVRDGSGVLIVPRKSRLVVYDRTVKNGKVLPMLAPLTAEDPASVTGSSEATELAEAAGPTWSFVGNHCFTQISDTWATLDHCYYKYKLANDGSSTYDWYALNRFGTASNNSPWVLDEAKIRAYRYSGSSQTWADWTPRSNWSAGSCSTVNIGISTPVGGLSKSFERCPEKVTFTKSANGSQPDYTQTWFGRRTRGNRELNFELAVRIKQGGTATWTLPAEVHGGPY